MLLLLLLHDLSHHLLQLPVLLVVRLFLFELSLFHDGAQSVKAPRQLGFLAHFL